MTKQATEQQAKEQEMIAESADIKVPHRDVHQRRRFWGSFWQIVLMLWVSFTVFNLAPPASILFGMIFLMTLPLWLTLPGMLKGGLWGSFWGAVVAMFYVAISVMEIYDSPAAGIFPWITAALATLLFIFASLNVASFKIKKADYKKMLQEKP